VPIIPLRCDRAVGHPYPWTTRDRSSRGRNCRQPKEGGAGAAGDARADASAGVLGRSGPVARARVARRRIGDRGQMAEVYVAVADGVRSAAMGAVHWASVGLASLEPLEREKPNAPDANK